MYNLRRNSWLAVLCLACPGIWATHLRSAYAADKRLAVLEFQGKRVDVGTLATFSDAVRGGALAGLTGQGISVMTRENMMALLKDAGNRECSEGDCEVETARNIGADYVISGAVTRIEDQYVASLKLHETKGGSLLGTDLAKGKTRLQLLDTLRDRGRALVRTHLTQAAFSGVPGGQEKRIDADNSFVTPDEHRVLVSFDSQPSGAMVLVDGELLCAETPCSKSLEVGRHNVEMHKERYERAQQTIDGKKKTLVHMTLRATFATLIVHTNPPGLPIAVDGKGPSLATGNLDIEPGQHELLLDHPCYLRTGEQVVAKKGERREIVLTARSRLSAIAVTAEDELGNEVEAKVMVDGTVVGTAPGTFKVNVCSREIVVRSDSGGFRGALKLIEKEVVRVKARLVAARPEPPKAIPSVAQPGGPFPMQPAAGAAPAAALQPALAQGCQSHQVAIPGGTFWMGSADWENDERPVHPVTLSPYCLDKFEVTVAAYGACVQSGVCTAPVSPWFRGRSCNWRGVGKDYHPINCVDWNQARVYCEWLGGSLPTEAQWELAARGSDNRIFPWGNVTPDSTRIHWNAEGTAAVGGHPLGASPFGILDMAGNVWEWTADTYQEFVNAAEVNPRRWVQGPASQVVIRGGGWRDNEPSSVRATVRKQYQANSSAIDIGFRCVGGG